MMQEVCVTSCSMRKAADNDFLCLMGMLWESGHTHPIVAPPWDLTPDCEMLISHN